MRRWQARYNVVRIRVELVMDSGELLCALRHRFLKGAGNFRIAPNFLCISAFKGSVPAAEL